MALMINLGYSQYCLSFGDAGSNFRECLVYFFKPKNLIGRHFQVYLVEKGRNLFQSFSVFMDEEEVILPFSPAILSYLLPAALKSIRLIRGIPLLDAKSLLERARRETSFPPFLVWKTLYRVLFPPEYPAHNPHL